LRAHRSTSRSHTADAYKLDKSSERRFRPLGSLAYDDRILRYDQDSVSIWTVGGRLRIAFVCGVRQRTFLASRQGESGLVDRDGAWNLLATVNVIEPPTGEVDDYLRH
jgi:putative transposase